MTAKKNSTVSAKGLEIRAVLTNEGWIDATSAIGIQSKAGRYGGTYAHSDIAFEFASWLSPEFKLYIIKDYQRLKSNVCKSFGVSRGISLNRCRERQARSA